MGMGEKVEVAYNENNSAGMHTDAGVARDRFDPLLVCLHDSAKGYSASKDQASFENLVHSVMAILDANLTESEKLLAGDILINMIRQASADLRSSLTERLAVRDSLPSSLLHFLAYGEIDVAEAVLLYSPLLSSTDLLYIIQSKSEDHWRVIARRAEISDKVCLSLASKNDVDTNINLLRNQSVDLSEEPLKLMSTVVSHSDEFAGEFIEYKHLPKELAVSIYWHVSVAMRHLIANQFPLKDTELDRAMEDCIQDFTDTMMKDVTSFKPSSLMLEIARNYAARDAIVESFLVNVLRRRQGRFFVALFAEKTGLDAHTVVELMSQKGGQGMAVACRATKVSKEAFVSLFLLSRAITSPSEIVNADELKMAMRYYDGLTYKVANEILTSSIAR